MGNLGPVTPPLAYQLGVVLTPTGGDCQGKMHTHSHAPTQEAAHFLREADRRLGSDPSVLPTRSLPEAGSWTGGDPCTSGGQGADEPVSAWGLAAEGTGDGGRVILLILLQQKAPPLSGPRIASRDGAPEG